MKDDHRLQSRRALLNLGVRSLAGAGLLGSLEHAGANATSRAASAAGDRALVCIYLLGGEGGSHLPIVAELQALHTAGALAVIKDVTQPARHRSTALAPDEIMARKYSSLRFLPNGFATPEWAARVADIAPVDGAGAFTFEGGTSVVSMDSSTRDGSQFENPAMRKAMREVRDLRTKFPDTTFGRRLEDVSRLLRASRVLGLKRPVFLFMAGGFTTGAKRSRTLSARYQELGQALAAFYEATVEVGLEHQVTTYTDAEFPTPDDRSNSARGIRIVLGGSVTQPSIVGSEITSDNYNACLARWYGLSANDLQHLFPEVAAPGLEVLA